MKKKKTVLIVDDYQVNRLILKKILQEDYDVLEAENGIRALAILETHWRSIAAVMLDLVMPEMDGFQFMQELDKYEDYANIPIIVTTGNSDTENEIRALEFGAWDFVSKPYDPRIIAFRLRNAIDRSLLSAFDQIKYMAEFDGMTDIYNKTKFFAVTHNMLMENPDRDFVFIRMDIDHFNLINSFYGRDEGDNVLRYVAGKLKTFVSSMEMGTFGRIEGDVFGLCLPWPGKERIESIIQEGQRLVKSYNLDFNINPAFGLTRITDHSLPVDTYYDQATMASKQIKGNYVNHYSYYDSEMGKAMAAEQSIANEMERALAEKQFVAYFQPKYDLATNRPAGAEALARWNHPEKGMISPGEFIPIFERNGFISKLDFYMWDLVCQYLRKWLDEGRRPHPVSVNISRVNLYNPKLVDIILDLTDKYDIPRELFNLELNESAYTDNPQVMQDTMDRLKENGFITLMDDFGSGYSSLNVLKDIEVDVLKIDMRFFSACRIPGRGENIIASVVRMAKWLGIPTIAEGVEEKGQVEFLKGIGCNYVQGFYFSRPIPAQDYEAIADSEEVFEDRTEAHFDADTLWMNNSQMEFMFANVTQPMGIYEYGDGHLELLRVNAAFYDLFGYNDPAIQNVESIEPVAPEYRQRVLDAFERGIEEKHTECEYLRKTQDGSIKWIHADLKYVNAVGGKHVFFATLSDITTQRKIDEELMKYRAAVEKGNTTETNNILVVDDLDVNRDILEQMFRNRFNVLTAENGREALQVLAEHNNCVDLILLDMVMPVMDGVEFLEYKKHHIEIADIPVVIITVDDTPQLQRQTLELGASDYVVKPFVEEIVVRRVQNVLDSTRRLRDVLREYDSALEQAQQDDLTGVTGRVTAEMHINNVLRASSRGEHAFIMLDIDEFKMINDRFGHVLGDKVLVAVGQTLKHFFRDGDVVTRLGGDEFGVLMTNIHDPEDVIKKCIALCKHVGDMVFDDVRVTFSIGIAMNAGGEETFADLYAHADEALYRSKRLGKNRVTVLGSNRSGEPILAQSDD